MYVEREIDVFNKRGTYLDRFSDIYSEKPLYVFNFLFLAYSWLCSGMTDSG